MGSVHKIKLGINGFGRIGRFVATKKPFRVFGIKSSEEIPLARIGTKCGVFNGNGNSSAQLKAINGRNIMYSVTAARKNFHGPSMMDGRSGRVASFCTIPGTPEDTNVVKSDQVSVNSEEIKTDVVEEVLGEQTSAEFDGSTSSSKSELKAGAIKSTISLFPSFGSEFLYLRDGAGMYNNLFMEDARENYVRKLKKKCFNLIGKSEKVMGLVEKCLAKNGPDGLTKEMEMMIKLILIANKVPFACNSYKNEAKKMRHVVTKSTNTKTSVESVKLRTIYQSASMIAQDICAQLKTKTQFRIIFGKIIREIPIEMKNGVEGIRIACSGRINGAEIARTECGKYGKTSRTTISQKVDYARAEALTRSGLIGVKVWITYRKTKPALST